MRQYRLITANSGLMSHLMNRPLQGLGWELRVEFDETGEVGDDAAVVFTPEGDELCRHRLAGGPQVLREIREAIQQDVQTDAELADTIETLEQRPPLICVRVMPTGGVLATLWLSGEEMVPSPGETGADDARPISRGPNALAELTETLAAWKAAHPGAVVDSEVPLADLVDDDDTPLPPALAAMAPSGQPQQTGAETIQQVPIAEITHFPGGNIRERFEDLDQLAESIRHHGVLEPLIVNRRGGRYVLIAGERRLRAAGLAGLTTVPCRVLQLNDLEALELMLIENIQRQNLNPIEEARAYQRLLAMPGATQGSVAQRLGKPREYVNEMLRLLGLPAVLSQLVATGELSRRAGLEFMRRTGDLPEETRQRIARSVAVQRPTAREMGPLLDTLLAAEGVARATPPAAPPPPSAPAPVTSVSASAVPHPAPAAPPTPSAPPARDLTSPPAAEALPASVAPSPVEQPAPAVARLTLPPPPAAEPFEADPASAHRLAEIGRRFWTIAPGDPWSGYTGAHYEECLLTYEAYLPLPRLLEFWEELQSIGATSIPRTIGAGCRINIPEQRLWIQQYDQYYSSVEFDLSPERLRIKLSSGGVDLSYQGDPVYYRATGGTKYLRQQVVIPDGDRHIVLTGSGSVLLRRELLKRWDALLQTLPAFPEEVNAHVNAGD